MVVTHASPEIVDGAKLQLLYRALAPSDLLCDFANGLLFYEAQLNHPALIRREFADEFEDLRASFDRLEIDLLRHVRQGHLAFASDAASPVSDCIRGDAEQPGGERNPAPFETVKILERVVKHLGGQFFRVPAIANAVRQVGVDVIEVGLVQVCESTRVALRRRDQFWLIGWFHWSATPHLYQV